jgi:hypothetical protein
VTDEQLRELVQLAEQLCDAIARHDLPETARLLDLLDDTMSRLKAGAQHDGAS